MEDKGYVHRFVWTDPFWHGLPGSGDKNALLPAGRTSFSWEIL